MNCPIGRCVGNTLEVMESLECLKGRGPDDILELVTSLGEEYTQTHRHTNSVNWFLWTKTKQNKT